MRMPENARGGTRAVVSRSMMNKGHAWCLWVHRCPFVLHNGIEAAGNKGAMGQFPLALAHGMTACRNDMFHSALSGPGLLYCRCACGERQEEQPAPERRAKKLMLSLPGTFY